MKYELTVNFDVFENVYIDKERDIYKIGLTITPDIELDKLLEPLNWRAFLEKELDILGPNDVLFKDKINLIHELLNNDANILDNCLCIKVNDLDGGLDYIRNNPRFKNFNIVLVGAFDVNHEDLNRVIRALGRDSLIKVKIDGNDEPISITEYEKTVLAIDEIVNKIQKYHLSPIEKLAYAYDLVRNRVYTKENDDEQKTISRDITSVLFGDKIVCVGYAKILDKVLQRLGIKAALYETIRKDRTARHMRNIVYIQDEKYHIDGVFFCDPTWDSKKHLDDMSYLDNYKYFCKSKSEMEMFEQGRYLNCTWPTYDDDFASSFESIVRTKGLSSISKDMANIINSIAHFIDGKSILPIVLISNITNIPEHLIAGFDLESVIASLYRYQDLFFERSIEPDILLKILYNVRKVEYYEEPDKYPFTYDGFARMMVRNGQKSAPVILLDAIFGKALDGLDEKQFQEMAQDMHLEEAIARVKLAKVLQLTLTKKNKD